ncbi:hypothetical protein Cs7R123_37890 [Catellatospora sp. TT07R-123]|nr:hypothetical protein Cs7R123_37890 [Catellatospora sp. TT07R-123]
MVLEATDSCRPGECSTAGECESLLPEDLRRPVRNSPWNQENDARRAGNRRTFVTSS